MEAERNPLLNFIAYIIANIIVVSCTILMFEGYFWSIVQTIVIIFMTLIVIVSFKETQVFSKKNYKESNKNIPIIPIIILTLTIILSNEKLFWSFLILIGGLFCIISTVIIFIRLIEYKILVITTSKVILHESIKILLLVIVGLIIILLTKLYSSLNIAQSTKVIIFYEQHVLSSVDLFLSFATSKILLTCFTIFLLINYLYFNGNRILSFMKYWSVLNYLVLIVFTISLFSFIKIGEINKHTSHVIQKHKEYLNEIELRKKEERYKILVSNFIMNEIERKEVKEVLSNGIDADSYELMEFHVIISILKNNLPVSDASKIMSDILIETMPSEYSKPDSHHSKEKLTKILEKIEIELDNHISAEKKYKIEILGNMVSILFPSINNQYLNTLFGSVVKSLLSQYEKTSPKAIYDADSAARWHDKIFSGINYQKVFEKIMDRKNQLSNKKPIKLTITSKISERIIKQWQKAIAIKEKELFKQQEQRELLTRQKELKRHALLEQLRLVKLFKKFNQFEQLNQFEQTRLLKKIGEFELEQIEMLGLVQLEQVLIDQLQSLGGYSISSSMSGSGRSFRGTRPRGRR